MRVARIPRLLLSLAAAALPACAGSVAPTPNGADPDGAAAPDVPGTEETLVAPGHALADAAPDPGPTSPDTPAAPHTTEDVVSDVGADVPSPPGCPPDREALPAPFLSPRQARIRPGNSVRSADIFVESSVPIHDSMRSSKRGLSR